MKNKTAVQELIEYFTKEEKKGTSHWCVHDLIAKLYVSKEMEKQQIIDAYHEGKRNYGVHSVNESEQYYNETFKQDETL